MSTQTTNYGLVKPDVEEFYDVGVMNNNLDIIDTTLKSKADQTEVDSLKKSVSDGKTTVANAITGKGVATASDATFATMATNINAIKVGIDTSGATASVSDILTGKTAGVGGAIITGTMTNNGAVNMSLAVNGTYTIPSGYHNGSGKVTQSITTKAAATYTPSDSIQTIAASQYLSGVQTISAVPTETKTTTAGTSATTVSRTSGKYMTSVTVNPTPSQTKSVTMTSSPMTITPDAGKLLSSVTVSGAILYSTAVTTVFNDNNPMITVSYSGSSSSVQCSLASFTTTRNSYEQIICTHVTNAISGSFGGQSYNAKSMIVPDIGICTYIYVNGATYYYPICTYGSISPYYYVTDNGNGTYTHKIAVPVSASGCYVSIKAY